MLWPASYTLARLMDEYKCESKSILEVGCGIGLSSLVLNKKNADITATDYHPESKKFLAENTKLNCDSEIEFILSNWNEDNNKLGEFDLIIGSDLLYEDTHAKLLANFINLHANQKCEMIMVSPNRGYQIEFNDEMKKFSFNLEIVEPEKIDKADAIFTGNIYKYCRL